MIWYLAFTGMFVLYQLDVAVYSILALCAKISEILFPEPGNPWHSFWHKTKFTDPAECDERGFKLSAQAAAAGCGVKTGKHFTAPQAAASWRITTHERVSISSMGTSMLGGSSVAGSSASAAYGSDCSSSAASGSQASTPRAAVVTPRTALQQFFAQLPAHSPLATVYSEHLPSSPEAAKSPHVSAKGLRFRAGGSDDGSKASSCVQDYDGSRCTADYSSTAAKTAATAATAANPDARWWSTAIQPDSGTDGCLTGVPPPSSAVIGADRSCQLPASLVSLYGYFPLVLVQLPMYNEEAHCEVVIERACNILWPRDRIIIQACDDSTRDDVKQRIDAKVLAMRHQGHNCLVTRRAVNKGFKAGNMINGMAYLEQIPWEYVAVFDADFEMPPDFLYQTIWHMELDRRLGFVQTRWSFTNAYDNLLCWAQAVSLNFHFAVEQRSRSFLRTFFGFNGTAGVWRRTAMEQAGGWNMESTVEDMDLSLRAYLNGWKFKYLHWVSCPNELPPTMSAYKTQQYRWNSGPMVVIKQLVSRVWTTDKVTSRDRISCSYFFFRFIYSAFLTVICLMCPAIVIWLDPWQWTWAPMMFLIAGNTTALSFFWFAGLLFWPYLLLQTGVGYFRVYAMINGLLGTKKSGTWKVTKKFGKGGLSGRVYHKPYMLEMLLALVFWGYAFAAVWYGVYVLASFCWSMAWTFIMISFGEYLF